MIIYSIVIFVSWICSIFIPIWFVTDNTEGAYENSIDTSDAHFLRR